MDYVFFQIMQFVTDHRGSLLLLLLVLNLLDVLTTHEILALGGVELNPIARHFMKLNALRPWVGLVVLKVLVFGLLDIAFGYISVADAALVVAALCWIYIVVVFNNVYVIHQLEAP